MTVKELEQYYDDIYKAEEAKRLADTNAQLQEYNTQKEQAAAAIDQANRGLYTDYVKAKTDLPAILARQGITGGASETSNIRLTSGYMNNFSENERKKAEQLSGLDDKITALKSTSRNALAALRAESALDKYNAIAKLNKEAYQTALAEAKLKAGYGDFSGYRALGIDTAAMEAAYSAKASAAAAKASASKSTKAPSAQTSGTGAVANNTPAKGSIADKFRTNVFAYDPEIAALNATSDLLDKYLKK